MSLFKSFMTVCLIACCSFYSQASAQVLSDNNANLPGIWAGSTAWGDYDGDGDPDLLITGLTGPAENCIPIARIYRNNAGALTDINAGLPGIYLGKAAWGDYDGDGDLDVAISGFQGNDGLTHIYRNNNGTNIKYGDYWCTYSRTNS